MEHAKTHLECFVASVMMVTLWTIPVVIVQTLMSAKAHSLASMDTVPTWKAVFDVFVQLRTV